LLPLLVFDITFIYHLILHPASLVENLVEMTIKEIRGVLINSTLKSQKVDLGQESYINTIVGQKLSSLNNNLA
jgi:hypothetical protein